MAGFQWRDEDPGGDQSTVWYERAVSHPDQGVREENRARLLAYNEDDVKATAAIREWLTRISFPGLAASTTFGPSVLSNLGSILQSGPRRQPRA